ncbi:hypothetical protein BKA62DRAFT_673164 [Auriculariales sp. MPI-PUGE-AT-0066]|nr:hypothetical protein BKA62DRAFT_673164 [Auriculariales sp. MPI-PUGE-AT-0066]
MARPSAPPQLRLNSDKDTFDDLYRSVSGAQVEAQGAEKTFNKISDGLMGANAKYQGMQNSTLVAGAMAIKAADPAQLVSKGMAAVNKFAENSQVILKGLDAVKTIHPFIGIIVTAAAAAIQLELTRRENDKKVIALKSEMLGMMEVLLDMRNIKDPKKAAPDGSTIEGRMQRIVQAAEQCIRDCSATCEKYIHKKFIVKLFDGSRWEDRLAAFSDQFAERKKEFQFALSIHTAQGVDEVQVTLTRFEASSKEGQDASHMILLFRQLESPKERDLQRWISERGGPKAVSENEKLFKELQAKMKDSGTTAGKDKAETSEAIMIQIRDEMREDIDRALAKDRKQFDRKFDAVQNSINELQNVVHRSTDRVISAINAGPHDRIVDMDLHAIWKEMAWRGSVKARHFIVAVQDYFLQKYSKEDEETDAAIRDAYDGGSRPLTPAPMSAISDGPPPSAILTKAIEARVVQRELQDRWAIEYITLTRVRPVLEAFDDDASGWISVKEANVFTSGRPQDYSVIKWLAFWAAGFKISSAHDAQSIQNLRAQMIAYSYNVLPCNRARVDRYLYNPNMDGIDYLTRSMATDWSDDDEDEGLMSHLLIWYRSNEYLQSEKERLKKGLEGIGWEIDAFNTLQLITGTGRIERNLLPLIFLLLERHTQIIQLAQSHPLHDLELWDAERTIDVVAQAVLSRVQTLASNFRNQNMDPKAEFDYAYGGMASPVGDFEYDEEYYDWDNQPDTSILKYGPTYLSTPDYIYEEVNLEDEVSPAPFEGYYTGIETFENSKKWQDGFVLTKLELNPNEPGPEGSEALKGSGRDSYGIFEIKGHMKAGAKPNQKRIEYKKFESSGSFMFDRTPAVARRYRPSKEDKATTRLARVGMLLSTSSRNKSVARLELELLPSSQGPAQRIYQCCHSNASPSTYSSAEADLFQRIRSIADSYRFPREWDEDDDEDHQQTVSTIQRALAPEDVLAYNFIADWKLQKECVHLGTTCDACEEQIIGGYYRCLDCTIPGDPTIAIELCTDCSDKPASHTTDNDQVLDHHPSHNMFKSLRVVQLRELVLVLKRCRDEIQSPLDILAKAETYLNRGGNEDDNEEEPYIPTCVYCDERVSKPCWYCTECSENCFICDACEEDQAAKALDYRYLAPKESTDNAPAEEADADKGTEAAAEKGAEEQDEEEEEDEDEDEEAGEDEEEGEGENEDEDADYVPPADGEEEDVDEDDGYNSSSESSASTEGETSHKWWHIINRVQDIPPEPPRVQLEMRLSMLEQKFAAHETMMRQRLDRLESAITSNDKSESINTRLDNVSETMTTRLNSLEQLLGQLLAKMG